MGDAGSQLLAFAIGVLGIRATQSATSEISTAIPILLLALPILDTLSAMGQRIGEGRSPFSADKNHIHRKLLSVGFDHHEAVMVIYAIQPALFATAYLPRSCINRTCCRGSRIGRLRLRWRSTPGSSSSMSRR